MVDKKPSLDTYTEKHEILGGDALVFRKPRHGAVYQFRCWVPGEKKYWKRSLRTRDLETALDRAKQEFYDIQHEIRSGKKVFGLTYREFVEQHLQYQQNRVDTGKIVAGRRSTIKTILERNLLSFLGDGDSKLGGNRKVSEIDKGKFYEYAQFRRKTRPGVSETTIRNEQTAINFLIKWGRREGLIHFDRVDFEEIKIREAGRRDTFEIEEWEKFYKFLRGWARQGKTPKQTERRQFVREFIYIKAQCYLRFGELRFLKWGDVKHDRNQDIVYISVRAETSKNRKSRQFPVEFTTNYFDRMKKLSNFTKKDDYIFCDNMNGRPISKKVYYDLWNDALSQSPIEPNGRTLTYYSLRHFGITMRLYTDISCERLSQFAGTSFRFIENHYRHTNPSKFVDDAKKQVRFDKDGNPYPIRKHLERFRGLK